MKQKVKYGRKFKKGQIRFNFKHGHYAHIKKIEENMVTSVFLSTKPFDKKKENIPLTKSIFDNDTKTYFLTRIRTYYKNTYSTDYLKHLSYKDKKVSNKIYKEALKRKK